MVKISWFVILTLGPITNLYAMVLSRGWTLLVVIHLGDH